MEYIDGAPNTWKKDTIKANTSPTQLNIPLLGLAWPLRGLRPPDMDEAIVDKSRALPVLESLWIEVRRRDKYKAGKRRQ